MPYHCLVPLIAAAANLVICALVLRRGMRERLHRAFVVMALAIVSWNLDIFCLYYFEDVTAAEWWSRVFRVGVCLAPATALHFALVLSETRTTRWRLVLGSAYLVGTFLAIANLEGSLVRSLTRHSWGWYVEPGPLYAGLTASLIVYLPLWAERVIWAYRHPSSPRQRTQAKFWLLAGLVQIPFALTNLLPIYGFHTYPLGDMGSVFLAGIVAYAIVRHRLMDVDYVVRKLVSFAAPVALVLLPGSLVLSALARALGADEPLIITCAAVALALVATVSVPTIQQALETRVHRAFFPQLYDYRLRLRQLAATLVHVLERAELLQRLGESLTDVCGVDRCEIYLPDDETGRLTLAYPSEPTGSAVPLPLAATLEELVGPTLASELADPGLAELCRSRGWEVVLPLRINDRLRGVVGLGANRDFRIFSGEDLQLLGTVAAGASVALENAHLSRQLRHSAVVLERANKLSSLGMLAAGLAHEIRNPLVAVKTFLDLLPQRAGDREFMTNFRDLSLAELRRVTDLITDLLALGKSTSTERRTVEIAPTIEPVARLMESTARKRGVTLVTTLEGELPPVLGDPDQLKQVFLNLLLNAIEVSPPDGRVGLLVRASRTQGEQVVIEVRDQGPGIPPEHLKSIFDPFFTTKETGTGLGLALVHQMVLEHGGDITIDSVAGRGSVFRVTLPAESMALAATG